MEEILKTTLLEFEKSAFIIDLIKHESGKQYISILQSIYEEETIEKRIIKINPSIISELLRVLNTYQDLINKESNKQQLEKDSTESNRKTTYPVSFFTESEKNAIQSRYLKGISISDLTIQFNCKAELIRQVLRNNNIVIIDNKYSKKLKRKRYKK